MGGDARLAAETANAATATINARKAMPSVMRWTRRPAPAPNNSASTSSLSRTRSSLSRSRLADSGHHSSASPIHETSLRACAGLPTTVSTRSQSFPSYPAKAWTSVHRATSAAIARASDAMASLMLSPHQLTLGVFGRNPHRRRNVPHGRQPRVVAAEQADRSPERCGPFDAPIQLAHQRTPALLLAERFTCRSLRRQDR